MGFFQKENQKTFKIVLLVVMVVIIAALSIGIIVNSQGTVSRTVLFEDNTYLFDSDVNTEGITTGKYFKSEIGFSVTAETFDPLFDIFVAEAPNTVIASRIPESTDNALVIQRSGPQNANFIDVVFWDSDTNRPLFVINAGAAGRASTLDRSLQVGKDFASDILNVDYTVCTGTSLADCDTLATGADLVVEDDIENFGSLQVHENATIDGNLSFDGAFGELFDSETQTMITITDANGFFPVGGIQTGSFRNVLVNDTNITTQIQGTYLANYSISFSNANNVNYIGGLMVNGVTQINGRAHRRLGANDLGNMSATAILSLNIGDNVSMAILNQSNNSDITIESTNLTLTYIGS